VDRELDDVVVVERVGDVDPQRLVRRQVQRLGLGEAVTHGTQSVARRPLTSRSSASIIFVAIFFKNTPPTDLIFQLQTTAQKRLN
jgi:hypothetical protein